MSTDKNKGNKESIQRLIDGFARNIQSLKSHQTSEAVVRQEYIDPFWKALGWDVTNKAHRSAAEKDVLVEAPVTTIEGQRLRSRRPDYLFRINGFPRFIVEAKAPSVDLATDRDAIFQAKTYAWNVQIPFAVLTDFEEFRLFDTTIKPFHGQPRSGVIEDFDLRFEDFANQWDVLWNTFSREAVANGSLEELLRKLKKVRKGRRIRGIDRMLIDLRGSEPVDRAFLAHLEDYRERFARAMYRDNRSAFPEADTRPGAAKLTEAAQRLIDRLVFARVCEDRDISPYGGLHDDVDRAVRDNTDLYSNLTARFRNLDKEYNGYLFKFHFSEELGIPSQLLADFIRSLYMPDGPYRFDLIGDDILGIIYERFLGSVIIVDGNNVRAEEKPEVRHAGGVYYTPRFVVDTIIRRVIGPQVEGRTPLEILDLKILDMACGSGSFLIAAFQHLMDHCVTHFKQHPEDVEVPATPRSRKKKRQLAFQDDEGEWHLAPDFKAALLTSCLHGVDIDGQAVEVTIMSLYLKMLEGKLPPNWQRDWLESQLLPPLDNNIRCGNSLLSQTDFDRWWDNNHATLFNIDANIRFRMNPFDWKSLTRGFGRIFEERKGFDAVIGNPPYIRVQELNKWAPDECEFYKSHYKSAAKGNYDIYVVFIERALQLLASDGLMGFITPHKYWQAKYGEGIRKIIAEGLHLKSIIDFTDQQVFQGATTYTAIQVLSKQANQNDIDYARITELEDGNQQCLDIDDPFTQSTDEKFNSPQMLDEQAWVFSNASFSAWLNSVKISNPTLSDITSKIAQGLVSGCDRVFYMLRERGGYRSIATGKLHKIDKSLLHPLLKGSVHIKRWIPLQSNLHALFPYRQQRGDWKLIECEELAESYPTTFKYLKECRNFLEKRENGRFVGNHFYQFSRPQNFDVMSTQKILAPSIGRKSEYCLDSDGSFYFVGSGGGGGGGYAIIPSIDIDLFYLCGLLNSSCLDVYLKQITSRFHSGWYAYSASYIGQLPIKLPETKEEKKLANRVVERVKRIIETKKKLQATKLGQNQRVRLERQVEADESRIDELVCQLYGVDKIPDI